MNFVWVFVVEFDLILCDEVMLVFDIVVGVVIIELLCDL